MGCAVPLVHGAHEFQSDSGPWHCACLIRYQQSELLLVYERLETRRAAHEAMRPCITVIEAFAAQDLARDACPETCAAITQIVAAWRAAEAK